MKQPEYYDPKTARHFIDSLDHHFYPGETGFNERKRDKQTNTGWYNNLTPLEDKPKQRRGGRKRSDKPIEEREIEYAQKRTRKRLVDMKRRGVYPRDDIRRQSNRNMYDLLMYLYKNTKQPKVVSILELCIEYNLRGLRGGILPGLIASGLCVRSDIKNELQWVGKRPTRLSSIRFKQDYVCTYYNYRKCVDKNNL